MKFFSLALALVVAKCSLAANTKPLRFFVTYDYQFIPLTARDYKGIGLLMHNDPTGESVTFTLEEGKYAVTTETSTPGYAGIYEEVLAFGPNVAKTALDLDPQDCVLNAAFYSCKFLDETARIITPARVTDDCFSVKVLLVTDDIDIQKVLLD